MILFFPPPVYEFKLSFVSLNIYYEIIFFIIIMIKMTLFEMKLKRGCCIVCQMQHYYGLLTGTGQNCQLLRHHHTSSIAADEKFQF